MTDDIEIRSLRDIGYFKDRKSGKRRHHVLDYWDLGNRVTEESTKCPECRRESVWYEVDE